MARASRSLRIRLALMLVLACALVALAASTAFASIASEATISGTVRDALGVDAIPYAYVDVYYDAGGDWEYSDWFYTDAAGEYSCTVDPGTYIVGFYASGGTYEYYEEVSSDIDATPLVVVDGTETYTGIDGTLENLGNTIGGTVMGSDGVPVDYASLDAYYFDGNDWVWYSSIQADANGRYAFYNLPTDNYRLGINDWYNYVYEYEYYNDAPDVYSATDIPVVAGATTIRDVVLTAPPSISGTVTDATTSLPVSNCYAGAYWRMDDGWGIDLWSQATSADGRYSVHGVTPGVEYAIYISDADYRYAEQYYSGESYIGQATFVTATAEGVTGIDVALVPWEQNYATIEGTVYDTADGVVPYASVDFFADTGFGWQSLEWSQADENGFYSYSIWSGDYRVGFSADGYLNSYYDGAGTLDEGTPVSLDPGQTVTGINGVLDFGSLGSISGTLTGAGSGDPVYPAWVGTLADDGMGGWFWTDFGQFTDEFGDYWFECPPGDQIVGFWTWDCYTTEYWNDAGTADEATPVTVEPDTERSGIDAVLNPVYGTIDGTITDAVTGLPLTDAYVTAWFYDDGIEEWLQFDVQAWTDHVGYYNLKLPGGVYVLSFTDDLGRHHTEFFDNTPSPDVATQLVVGTGSSQTRDAALNPAEPSIIGTVRDAADLTPIEGVWIDAIGFDGFDYWVDGWGETAANGEYAVYGLGDGDYALYFDSQAYLPLYYNQQEDLSTADLVTTQQDVTIPDIDALLTARGEATITGQVTGSDTGLGLEDIEVDVYYEDVDGWYEYDWASTDYEGFYGMSVPAQYSYAVEFYDWNDDYVSEYFDNQSLIEDATPIYTEDGGVYIADAELARLATISGTVTDDVSSDPVSYAWIAIHRADGMGGWEYDYDWTQADAWGRYSVGVEPGEYLVQFFGPAGTYLSEYWQEAANEAAATPIEIFEDEQFTQIDGTLTPNYGTISGQVMEEVIEEGISSGYVQLWYYDEFDEEWIPWEYIETDENGYYSVKVMPGNYVLEFGDWTARHHTEFFYDSPGIEGAMPITVIAHDEITCGALLAPAEPSVTGTVREVGTLTPVEYAWVDAWAYNEDEGYWDSVMWGEGDENGDFAIWGLGNGSYALGFSGDGYVYSFYDGKESPETADFVDTTDGSTVEGIDVLLEPIGSGTISGQILGEDTMAGIPYADVELLLMAEDGWEWIDYGSADASGHYIFNVEARSSYGLYFADYNGNHVAEYYDDVAELDLATLIEITPDDHFVADAVLASGATISGAVTDGALPVAGVEVMACVPDGEGSWWTVDGAVTEDDGTYTINGLPAGTYKVWFCEWETGTHLSEWWNDKPDFETADDITLGEAEDRTGIDAVLAPAGRIFGSVSDGAGPISDVSVWVYGTDGLGNWNPVGNGWTDENGDYFVGGLPTGTYRLYFEDEWWFGFDRYVAEYYNDVSSIEFATDVPVVAGADVTGYDAVLDSTAGWSTISGTVKDSISGSPVMAMVDLVCPADEGWEYVDYTVTEPDGTYSFNYVENGEYIVEAYSWSNGYDYGYHLDASAIESAELVTVAAVPVTGIDVLLDPAPGTGRIEGLIQDAAGPSPIPGAAVEIYQYYEDEEWSGWDISASTITDADGVYSVAVYPGEYKVRFVAPPYATQWFNGAVTMADATPILVDPEETETANALLGDGASISGNFSGYLPDSYVEARLWREVAGEFEVFEDWRPAEGPSYSFEGLPEGNYRLEYRGWTEQETVFAQLFWDGAYDLSSALDIPVATGEDVTINPLLEAGAVIDVELSSDDGALDWPLTLTVWRLGDTGYEVYREELAWAEGWGYPIDNLPAGEYRIQASDTWEGHYADIWYPNGVDMPHSLAITVAPGDVKTVQFVMDALPPALSDDHVALYDDTATVEMSADDFVVGVASISYRLDGATTDTTVNADVASVTTSVIGAHTLRYSAVDKLGHVSAPKTVTFTVRDTLAPQPLDDAEETYSNGGTIGLWGDDGTGGGVTKIEYQLDTAASKTTVNAATTNVTVPYGAASLTYTVFDAAGNSASQTRDFTVSDTIAPSVATDNKGTYYGSASVKITATDAGSKPKRIEYKVGSETTQTVNASVPLATSLIATVSKNVVGTHTVRYAAFDDANNRTEGQFTFTILENKLTQVPLQGDNRYETAIEIALQAFDTAETAVLATGENWPDALGGAALAGAYDGPILLVRTKSVPAEVMAAMDGLGVDDVIVLGGKAAVSAEVETALKAKYGFKRIGGANRFETSRLIAGEVSKKLAGSFPAKAFVATGKNFPDALAGSPISAAKGWPIYLVGDAITAGEMNTFKAHGVKDLVILGGTGVVNGTVEKSVRASFGTSHVRRVAGTNRYETAVKVAQLGIGECGLKWNKLALATGANFPDALAGGVLQGKDDSVMLLTPGTSLDKTVESVLVANKASIYEVRFLGGASAINSAVRTKVQAILKK